MAWPTRSSVLWALVRATAVANTRYSSGSVPTGSRWLLKDISVYNDVNATRTFYFGVKKGGTEHVTGSVAILAFGVFNTRSMAQVVNAGDELLIWVTSGTAGFHVYACGAAL